MPGVSAILAHYAWLGVDLAWPFCFACWSEELEWSQLERAHLVDRSAGGLDGPQNVVLLCPACHRAMPSFRPGEGAEARRWVADREWCMTRWLRLAGTVVGRVQDGMPEAAAVALVCRLNRRV